MKWKMGGLLGFNKLPTKSHKPVVCAINEIKYAIVLPVSNELPLLIASLLMIDGISLTLTHKKDKIMNNFSKPVLFALAFFASNAFSATSVESLPSSIPNAVDLFQISCNGANNERMEFRVSTRSGPAVQATIIGPNKLLRTAVPSGASSSSPNTVVLGGKGSYVVALERVAQAAKASDYEYSYACYYKNARGALLRNSESIVRLQNNALSGIVASAAARSGGASITTNGAPYKKIIYRSNTPTGVYTKIGVLESGKTVFNDMSVSPGVIYWYKVSAVWSSPAFGSYQINEQNPVTFSTPVSVLVQ